MTLSCHRRCVQRCVTVEVPCLQPLIVILKQSYEDKVDSVCPGIVLQRCMVVPQVTEEATALAFRVFRMLMVAAEKSWGSEALEANSFGFCAPWTIIAFQESLGALWPP